MLLAEQERWPLWCPVFLGTGAALYFALPTEPKGWVGFSLLVAGLAALAAVPGLWARLGAVALVLTAVGFGAAQGRSHWVAAPVLDRMTGAVMVAGKVSLVEAIAEGGGLRVTIDDPAFPGGPKLSRVRIRLRDKTVAESPMIAVGARIAVRATLLAPIRPAFPGAYDFPRKAYFMGLGATGLALGPVLILAPADAGSGRIWLNHLRQSIAERIKAALPGTNGAVATAIITGETTGIGPDVSAAYRNSGLAHILVIAGLHMGLLSGFVFFVVRGGLALVPWVALRFPIKKWAASVALVVIGLYMALAGFPVPATRSFIMAAVVLIAVMLDRGALSLRLWAFAASVIVLVEPEQIVGPSYQMSFSAVLVLIVTYERLAEPLARLRRRLPGWWGRVVLHMTRLALTSFMAGAATMVYGMYHFDRIAPWQVLANLAAVPVVGVLVMPFGLAGLLLMPFGLDYWPFQVMGAGIDLVTAIGFWGANLPLALIAMPPLPPWGLALFSLGGLWLCLWRGDWRLLGLGAMAVGLAALAFVRPPDVLIDEKGSAWAVRTDEGSLLISRGGRTQRETWIARAGPEAVAFWPKHGRSADGRLSCDPDWCLYRTARYRVALVKAEAVLPQVCADANDVVIAQVPIRDQCPGAKVVIDRFDVWRRGAHALWLTDGAVKVESVGGWQGDRPWSFHPRQRQKTYVPAPSEGEDSDD